MIEVTSEPFDPAAALSRFAQGPGVGAVASFVGLVRDTGGVGALTLQHYPGFTEAAITAIADAIQAKYALSDVAVIHRVGRMAPGDPIVFAATSAPHRRAALDALDELMDRLKTQAPFWKYEEGDTGGAWVDPRGDDYDAATRWETSE